MFGSRWHSQWNDFTPFVILWNELQSAPFPVQRKWLEPSQLLPLWAFRTFGSSLKSLFTTPCHLLSPCKMSFVPIILALVSASKCCTITIIETIMGLWMLLPNLIQMVLVSVANSFNVCVFDDSNSNPILVVIHFYYSYKSYCMSFSGDLTYKQNLNRICMSALMVERESCSVSFFYFMYFQCRWNSERLENTRL